MTDFAALQVRRIARLLSMSISFLSAAFSVNKIISNTKEKERVEGLGVEEEGGPAVCLGARGDLSSLLFSPERCSMVQEHEGMLLQETI